VDYENYTGASCIPDDIPMIVGMIIPYIITYLLNLTIFFIITVSILKNYAKLINDSDYKKLFKRFLVAVLLSVELGVSWGWGLIVLITIPIDLNLSSIFFAIFNISIVFQGFFIFLICAVRNKDVRNLWKRCLCIACKKCSATNQVVQSTSQPTNPSTI
jgi:hypothetical protein